MWEFSPDDIKPHVGEKSLRKIRSLLSGYEFQNAEKFSFSPSIICRSEIELLGLSTPRFAYRLFIKNLAGETGFLNIRRLADLYNHLGNRRLHGWNETTNQPQVYTEDELNLGRENLAPLLLSSGPFAESILPKPTRLTKYDVISCDYQELFGLDQPVVGTPFVNALLIGGSMCGHATVFMSLLMMLPYVTSVVCPSELAALLVEATVDLPEEIVANSFEVKGFETGDFPMIFKNNRIALNTFQEIGKIDPRLITPDPNDETLRFPKPREFMPFRSARAYVRSGFPVILIVDGERFTKVLNTINERNNNATRYVEAATEQDDAEIRHSILIVGTGTGQPSQFVIHDPSTLPFRDFAEMDLANCLPDGFGSNGPLTSDTRQWSMFPVLPKGINLSLLDTLNSESRFGTSHGLVGLSEQILNRKRRPPGTTQYTDSSNRTESLPFWERTESFGEFRIVSKANFLSQASFGELLEQFQSEDELIKNLLYRIMDFNNDELPDWMWLQVVQHKISHGIHASGWVWDATKALRSNHVDLVDHLILVETCTAATGDDYESVWTNPRITKRTTLDCDAGEKNESHPVPDCAGLEFGVLSSCVLRSFPESLKLHRQLGGRCELYCFMQSDVQMIRSSFASIPEELSCSWEQVDLNALLSWIGKSDERVRLLAKLIADSCEGVQLIGLASYLPEISLPPECSQRQHAVGALRMLIKLACQLKNAHGQSELTSIEFVGGSRCIGLDWHQINPRKAIVGFAQLDVEIKWLADSLNVAAEGLIDLMTTHRIALAAELEPGILKSLATPKALRMLLDVVGGTPVGRVLGINIDTGHFAIARDLHPVDKLVEFDTCVSGLVSSAVHCHLSLHAPYKGHFCDRPLYFPYLPQPERHFIELFAQECRSTNNKNLQGRVPISHCISLELEASVGEDALLASVKNAKAALGFSAFA